MEVRFKQAKEYPQDFDKYRGNYDPQQHLKNCKDRLKQEGVPKDLWVHGFIHTLGMFLKAW